MRAVKWPLDKNKPVGQPDPEEAERFNRVLGETVEALEKTPIRYVFIGGIASGGLGRPRSTRDIDLFVRPEDAGLVLDALDKYGFRTEKTDPAWLYKGWKEGILVDVIFKSKGEIYLDPEMYQRVITAEFHGRRLKLVAPEDLLIIKAAAHSELTPGHWHDAIALLTHATIDWEYLVRRARRAPRRILSLLLYAQSNDIWVPNGVIHELYSNVFSESRPIHAAVPSGSAIVKVTAKATAKETAKDRKEARDQDQVKGASSKECYRIAHFRELLAEDPRTNELDIAAEFVEGKLVLRGEVSIPERKVATERLAREFFPEAVVDNQIRVLEVQSPLEQELK